MPVSDPYQEVPLPDGYQAILRDPGPARPSSDSQGLTDTDRAILDYARTAILELLRAMDANAPVIPSRSGTSTRIAFRNVVATLIGRQERAAGDVILKIRRPDTAAVRIIVRAHRWVPGPRSLACDMGAISTMAKALALNCLGHIDSGPSGLESLEMARLADAGRTHLLRAITAQPETGHPRIVVEHPWDGTAPSVCLVRKGGGVRRQTFHNRPGVVIVPRLDPFARVSTTGWGTNDLSVFFSSPVVSIDHSKLPADPDEARRLASDPSLDRLPIAA